MSQQGFYGFWSLVIGVVGLATNAIALETRPSDPSFSAPAIVQASDSPSSDVWYDRVPINRAYWAAFPAEPQTQGETQIILDRITKAYLVRQDEINIPTGVEVDVDTILDGARGGLSASGEIESERRIESNGVAGRELLVVGENGKILKARVFFDPENGRLYQVIVGAVDGELPQDADFFLESLTILR